MRRVLIGLAVGYLSLFVLVPLANVFAQALAGGVAAYWHVLVRDPDSLHAAILTLTVAPAAVAANLTLGVAAAWAIARFRFPGRAGLISLIDLPFSVSPVVAGNRSDSRATHARATGDGSRTSHPSGARPSHTSSKRSKPGIDLAATVRTGPAATRFTLMRRGPRSRARYRAHDSNAAFATPIQS